MSPGTELLRVEALQITYRVKAASQLQGADFVALNDVSFSLERGGTLGVVGESGSGKSTLARALVGLAPITRGAVYWGGERITGDDGTRRSHHLTDMQMVFQDPVAALNPRMTVAKLVAEPVLTHRPDLVAGDRLQLVIDTLQLVGLSEEYLKRYPHELSGGQAQRVGIARAIILNPRLLICDEAVSALDVSVQASILNLLKRLQRELGFAMIFIGHDLAVMRYLSDQILVLYAGHTMEFGPADSVIKQPRHPYTKLLTQSVLCVGKNAGLPMSGSFIEAPSALHGKAARGCEFRERCNLATSLCAQETPPFEANQANSHKVACHFSAIRER